MSQAEQPLISHLVELRTRLLRSVGAILLVFVALIYFSNDIYDFIAQPLLSQLPEGTSMIATDVATPFITPIKLTLVVSFFVAIPYLLYQAWAFIAPGLYQHERRLIMPLVASSAVLFYAGMAFAYYVVFPLVFGFFTSTAPAGVTVATDIASYLDFVLTLFLEAPLRHRRGLRGRHAADAAGCVLPDPVGDPHVGALGTGALLRPLLREERRRAGAGTIGRGELRLPSSFHASVRGVW